MEICLKEVDWDLTLGRSGFMRLLVRDNYCWSNPPLRDLQQIQSIEGVTNQNLVLLHPHQFFPSTQQSTCTSQISINHLGFERIFASGDATFVSKKFPV